LLAGQAQAQYPNEYHKRVTNHQISGLWCQEQACVCRTAVSCNG
jgi:hypothetical protein